MKRITTIKFLLFFQARLTPKTFPIANFNKVTTLTLLGPATSPGGTTVSGLAVFESRAVRAAFIEAVVAATT